MTARFGRVLTAMVTPFAQDGSIDVDLAVRLGKWLVDEGNEGLVITGTTGEAPTITDDEDVELWTAMAEALTVPIVAGAGTNDTVHSVEQTRRAVACGCDGVLAVTPYYNRPSQAGIRAHMTAIAEAAGDVPVMLYDIPFRTGRAMTTETLLALADVDNVVAVKDAKGDIPATTELIALAPDGFEVYSGEDKMTLALLAVGAVGVVGVATHWAAPETVAMIDAVERGDLAAARAANATMIPSYDFESTDEAPNPVPSKAVMRALGFPVGQPRLPVGPTPDGLDAAAAELLSALKATRS